MTIPEGSEAQETLWSSYRLDALKVYSFALNFNIGPLMDLTMTEIIDNDVTAEPTDIEYAYTQCPPCAFRRFVVHSLVLNLTSNDVEFPRLSMRRRSSDYLGGLRSLEGIWWISC